LDIATLATDTTVTLTPGTETGHFLAPVIEKTGLETYINELPADGFTTHTAPTDTPVPDETPPDDHDNFSSVSLQRPFAETILDRSNRHIATMLSRFAQLVKLCMAPEEDGATLETQASLSLQIEVEWQALVRLSTLLWQMNQRLTILHRSKKPKIFSN
jgi:hypothetical protein